MKNTLYPIKFEPILKSKIWGGEKLKNILNKSSQVKNIGESWEISDVEGDTSIIANGELKGNSLKQLLSTFKADLIGEKNYVEFGNTFPLLIKFIDAKEDLSIQLHPNDALAAKRHNSFGKTEMWYVMQADPDAKLIVGFNQPMDSDTYNKHLEEKTLPEILNFDNVKTGDSYFIDGGRVHAIGAGVLLAEIQQTSDITYRVYDWDRVDEAGNRRELHNDLAIEAFNFNMPDNFRVSYSKDENKANLMLNCSYFTTNYLNITTPIIKSNTHDSFLIYMCVAGEITINANGFSTTLKAGETVLIPAALKTVNLITENATLLEVYV
ncbi:mannose-6-phosphate isomerase [Bizionia argentinensis JUB59]|uniref:Phosphohexomutase n=1 Tax=Bizionia argentinensis JUB59 TaxID=1046627 RepID=G2EG35_9FLAO|nr:type I phosphomannose isomerase catalytic subunit [Bizionia argentinensis]EGV42620.1 mannose-6-phosphate isomerase [Bizionia argentinensis JUB59]